jgi:acetyltransferase-like isoleucine patch superfamily enzyme
MKISMLVGRFLLPRFVVSILYYIKFGCMVSPRAEVDFTEHLRIGRRTQISSFCKIKASSGKAKIGRNVSIGSGCFVGAGIEGVEIGDYCLIGPNCTIVSGNYNTSELETPFAQQGRNSKGTHIGRNVMVGANCVVLDGSIIGDNSIVSAGSVVSGRFQAGSVIQGNPASVIFERRA